MVLGMLLAATAALPSDVRAYVARRDLCEHYAGEDAYDGERRRFLDREIARNRCLTLDADRKRLRRLHAAPAVRRELRPLYY